MFVAATFMSFPDSRKWTKRTAPVEGAGTAPNCTPYFCAAPNNQNVGN